MLIADDNDMTRSVLNQYVTSRGILCGMAENGAQAIEMLVDAWQRGKPYDAAILDVTMPGISGTVMVRMYSKRSTHYASTPDYAEFDG